MTRLLRRIAAGILALGIVAIAAVTCALQPPPPLPSPAPGFELLRVNLVEPGGGRRQGMRLRVEGGRIAEIRPGAADARGPLLDATVLPGLNDMHVHLPLTGFPGDAEYTALLLLAHGITTARILGGTRADERDALERQIRDGLLPGPRLLTCGPFLDGPDPVLPGAVPVSGPEAARAAVERLAGEGVDCIKAYDRLDAASTVALREAAHARGLPIVGHTPQGVSLEEARLDDVQHLRGVHPPFADERRDYPHLLRPWHRQSEARLEQVIAISRRHGTTYTPTLVAIEGTLRSRDWQSWRAGPTLQAWLPALRDALRSGEVGFNPIRFMSGDDFAMVAHSFERMKHAVGRLHRAGIPLHTGSDANAPNVVPGASLHREIALLVEAGLAPEEALRAATHPAPRFLAGREAGRLHTGATADLAIFAEDPTRSPRALGTLLAVVQEGRLYPREDLEARLERRREHHASARFRALVMAPLRTTLRIVTAALRR